MGKLELKLLVKKEQIKMKQEFTNKNTSVNHIKVPYLISHIDWENFKGGRCLDYGSGKFNKKTFTVFMTHKIQYLPYDPFWLDEFTNNRAMTLYPSVVICSNVLNVIKEDEIVAHIHNYIRGLNVPYYIKIHEGDKSSVRKETRKDCFQRNEPKESYLYKDEVIYKGIITMPKYLFGIK